jgi:hypothetical protein
MRGQQLVACLTVLLASNASFLAASFVLSSPLAFVAAV